MAADVDLRMFVDHIRATKPPYDCPFGDCSKKYRSYNGICHHLLKDHNFNPHETTTSPMAAGARKSAPGVSNGGDVRQPTAREALTFAQAQKFVEVELDGQMVRLNIMEPLEVTLIDENLPPEKKSPVSALGKQREIKPPTSPKSRQLNDPGFRVLDDYVIPKNKHKMPNAYIRHIEPSQDEQEESVEYDMDEEDYAWLDLINSKRSGANQPRVAEDVFELIMDRLEKASHFQNQASGGGMDDDAVCCVCNDGECENTNAILFCDMCNIAVHQECYGVPYIPEGQWLCRRCQLSPSQAVDCCLCPNKGGAFKQTCDNRWAHVVCALWVPEVQFANTVFLEPIEGFERIPAARWKLSCCVCKQKGVGACIQCHKPTCYTAFHVTCAQQASLYMKMEPVRDLSPAGTTFSVKKTAFCDMHAPVEGEGRLGIKSPNMADRKRWSLSKIRQARKLLAKRRSVAPSVSIPVIPKNQLDAIAAQVKLTGKAAFMERIVGYWTLKRQSRFGVPLLRRLQVFHQNKRILKEAEENVELTVQARQWKRLRQDLERVRLLCELIRKREKLKREALQIWERTQELRLNPMSAFFCDVIDKIQAKDNTFHVFAKPVTEKDVKGYHSIIKHPMDLATMRRKAETWKYQSVLDLDKDFKLMIENCLRFNPKDSFFNKHAITIRREGNKIIEQAREIEKEAGYQTKLGVHLSEIAQLESSSGSEELGLPLRSPKKSPKKFARPADVEPATLPFVPKQSPPYAPLSPSGVQDDLTASANKKLKSVARRRAEAEIAAATSSESDSQSSIALDKPPPSPPKRRKFKKVVSGMDFGRKKRKRPISTDDESLSGQRRISDYFTALVAANPAEGSRKRSPARLLPSTHTGQREAHPVLPPVTLPVLDDATTSIASPKTARKRETKSRRKSRTASGSSLQSASLSVTPSSSTHLTAVVETSPTPEVNRRTRVLLGGKKGSLVRATGAKVSPVTVQIVDPSPNTTVSKSPRSPRQATQKKSGSPRGDEVSPTAVKDSFRKFRILDPTSPGVQSESGEDTVTEHDISEVASEDDSNMPLRKQRRLRLQPPEPVITAEPSTVPLEALDLVWAKVKGQPWMPGIVIDPGMPRTGLYFSDELITAPPSAVLDVKPARFAYLVMLFEQRRTWHWLTRDCLDLFGVDHELDKAKMAECKQQPDWKSRVQKAVQHASAHQRKVMGESSALAGDVSSDSDSRDL